MRICVAKAVDDAEVLEAFSEMGHYEFAHGSEEEAYKYYQNYLDWEPENVDIIVLNRCAQKYFESGDYPRALQAYLLLSKEFLSCRSLLGVAKSAIPLGQSRVAERALLKANQLNKTEPLQWGQITLLQLELSMNFCWCSLHFIFVTT